MKDAVSVVGLGKLGASMVAGFASKGFNVIGLDKYEDIVNKLNKHLSPVEETDVQDYIERFAEQISATTDYDFAVINSSITFVIVPTPSDERGAFITDFAEEAFKNIGSALKKKSDYHVVVLTSTVLPGATRTNLLPLLEKYSGKKCGSDFGLCYSPEFIALGTVIRDFLNPDFYLIGQFDQRSGDVLENINAKVANNNAPSKRMTIENAELAKISINGFVTMKISFANMLNQICEELPTGNIDEVTDALGLDSRIGKKYLRGGMGFGGPCFPRDNVALAFFADAVGVDSSLLKANHNFNVNLSQNIIDRLQINLSKKDVVSVLGLSYKPMSYVIEESSSIYLCKEILKKELKLKVYDPLAIKNAKTELGNKVQYSNSIDECIKSASVIFITNPDDAFLELLKVDFSKYDNQVIIYDFWRHLPNLAEKSNVIYKAGGKCDNSEIKAASLSSLWDK
jgi:UDPglucose 6-dehydrogenase